MHDLHSSLGRGRGHVSIAHINYRHQLSKSITDINYRHQLFKSITDIDLPALILLALELQVSTFGMAAT
jgi:hypothetical protein